MEILNAVKRIINMFIDMSFGLFQCPDVLSYMWVDECICEHLYIYTNLYMCICSKCIYTYTCAYI